jgi:hypothetical protein
MNRTIRTPRQGWEYWRLNRIDDGSLQWLALSRPASRSPMEGAKLWTLIPSRRIFLANWIVTEDHYRQEEPGIWVHENIGCEDAKHVALEVPQVSSEDLTRILHPERCLTLDQLDRFPADKILGARISNAAARR